MDDLYDAASGGAGGLTLASRRTPRRRLSGDSILSFLIDQRARRADLHVERYHAGREHAQGLIERRDIERGLLPWRHKRPQRSRLRPSRRREAIGSRCNPLMLRAPPCAIGRDTQ